MSITPSNSLTVSLKNEFIEYINNKNFKCVNYGDNNTWITNKNNLDKYLMICNHFGLISKLRDVIDDELDPMDIIYTHLSNTINRGMPEIIDDTFHVSKIAECLAINTKEGYYKLTNNDINKEVDNENNDEINKITNNTNSNNKEVGNKNKNTNKFVGINNQTEFNISFNSNQFLSNFRNENNIMNANLNKNMITTIKGTNLFTNIETNKECNNIITNDDVDRKILAIKMNILSLKHNNKSYSIYYGHLFESLMIDIMEYLINNGINISNNIDYKITNSIDSNDVYISNEFDDGVNILNKLINELEKEDDETKFNNSSHYVVGYNDVINKLTIYIDSSKNTADVYGIYLYNGLTSIVNEYIKHNNLIKENLLEIYNFIKELTNEFHDQELGLITYITILKYYIQFILTNQLKELIFTYIPNSHNGKVVNIIPKPRFDYGVVNGEGDFIIVVEKNNIAIDNNTDNLIYILADAKCYTSIKENEILKFSYQLIGYNQLHEHNKIIPSYRKQHNYSFNVFMIINPLNEINRTLTYYCVDLNEYNDDVDILIDNFERYLQKCITYNEYVKNNTNEDK